MSLIVRESYDHAGNENLPFNNGTSWVFQDFLPVFKSRSIEFGLIPAECNFANGISTTNQIVVTNLKKLKKFEIFHK